MNVWKTNLLDMGLAVGPSLRELKEAALRGAPDGTRLQAHTLGADRHPRPPGGRAARGAP